MECSSDCCEPHPAVSLEDDPTLADCCRRDLHEQKYVQSIKEKLLLYDRTNERINVANNAIFREVDKGRVGGDEDEETDSLATDSDEEPGQWFSGIYVNSLCHLETPSYDIWRHPACLRLSRAGRSGHFMLHAGLQEARERRLRQLQQSKILQETAAAQGAGSLKDVPEQKLLVSIHSTQCS